MSQKEAALTSVGEYFLRRKGYERQQQLEWERCRWMAFSIFSPFVGKNKPRTPMQWIKFPWEKQITTPMIPINEFQIKTLNEIFIDFKNRKA